MDRAEILKKITELLADVIERDDLVLTEATTADDVAEWDSLSHVRLIVAVESHFGIRFDVAQINKLGNVGQLIDLIQSKLNAR